jgi:hypothetical protein
MNGGCRQSASSLRRDQLSLKVADLDALQSGQPRAEENEADQKERRRIDVIVPTPVVRRQQRASGNHPEPPEVPEQRLPESIHWETACMTPNTKAQARAASVVLGLL